MNIFLPFENDVKASVECLDNARLNKQILECYQLLTSAIKEKNGEKPNGWYKHPVYVFYRDNIPFLAYYGWKCCQEYQYRFTRYHNLYDYFMNRVYELFIEYKNKIIPQPPYTPYYMEGSKGQPNYIRTTTGVSELFQAKLCKKWEQDKIKSKGARPTWTNREPPYFYKKYLENKNDKKV